MKAAARSRRQLLAVAATLAVATIAAGCSASGPGESTGAGHSSGRFESPTVDPPSHRPNFTLTDTGGRPYDFRQETDGKVTLLYFGYTHCPDVCPINLAQIHSVLSNGALGDVTVVFVSVDPARDTPARVRSWLDQTDPSFVGLVGTQAQVDAAERAAGVPLATKEGAGTNYTVGHAAQVIAYAPDNLGYVQFPFGTRQSTYTHDLHVLQNIAPEEDKPMPNAPFPERADQQ